MRNSRKNAKYLIQMNLSGLHERVYKVYDPEDEKSPWYDKTGNVGVEINKPAVEPGEIIQLVFDNEDEANTVLAALKHYKNHIAALL